MDKTQYLRKEDLELNEYVINNEYPIITAGTGSGKTYFAVNKLKEEFEKYTDKSLDFILLLVPTNSIKRQTINDYDICEELDITEFLERDEADNKIRVACFSVVAN